MSLNSGNIMMYGQETEHDAQVVLAPAHMVRPALTMNAARIVEDLIVLLRQPWTRN